MKYICKFNCNVNDGFDNITFANASVSRHDLPEVLNNFFISATAHIPPVDNDRLTALRRSLGPVNDAYIVDELDVYYVLDSLKTNKSTGPDCISNRILRNLADVLAAPICAIINSSIREGIIPEYWK